MPAACGRQPFQEMGQLLVSWCCALSFRSIPCGCRRRTATAPSQERQRCEHSCDSPYPASENQIGPFEARGPAAEWAEASRNDCIRSAGRAESDAVEHRGFFFDPNHPATQVKAFGEGARPSDEGGGFRDLFKEQDDPGGRAEPGRQGKDGGYPAAGFADFRNPFQMDDSLMVLVEADGVEPDRATDPQIRAAAFKRGLTRRSDEVGRFGRGDGVGECCARNRAQCRLVDLRPGDRVAFDLRRRDRVVLDFRGGDRVLLQLLSFG